MARRRFSTFNMSFLDVMSCGFGAVVLFYMIISAQVAVRADKENVELLAETNRLEEEVLDGRKNLVRLKTTVDEREQRRLELQAETERLQAEIETLRAQLSQKDDKGLAVNESVEQLQADIKRLEAAKQRLLAEERGGERSGRQVREFTGAGDRQYLTGMKMGGKRVAFLIDASASMLGRTYVNALLYRNMPESTRLRTPKWQSVVGAVDWITTRLSPAAQFQMFAFNNEAWTLVEGSDGDWVPVGEGKELSAAVNRLKVTVPQSGTSLYNAFAALSKLSPKPDNIYLLTDGLPTQSRVPPVREKLIRPTDRFKYFQAARNQLPIRVPVNVILFPMDGDPAAAGHFWRLAIDTRGSFLTPSADWP